MHMPSDRRAFIGAGLFTIAAAGARAAPAPGELYQSIGRAEVLAAAREVIGQGNLVTFITVDANSHPRARTVFVSAPDDDLTFWIGTRRGSRKLQQIADNPAATLHLAHDTDAMYLSLMGQARRITDPGLRETKSAYQGDTRTRFFPNYPDDFELIAFRPEWLEVATQKVTGSRTTWQPEGIAL